MKRRPRRPRRRGTLYLDPRTQIPRRTLRRAASPRPTDRRPAGTRLSSPRRASRSHTARPRRRLLAFLVKTRRSTFSKPRRAASGGRRAASAAGKRRRSSPAPRRPARSSRSCLVSRPSPRYSNRRHCPRVPRSASTRRHPTAARQSIARRRRLQKRPRAAPPSPPAGILSNPRRARLSSGLPRHRRSAACRLIHPRSRLSFVHTRP
mmetsp:Transcript_19842/g.51559  ORF Transcript_19842/g.51559 Transcript_19842/m.51559 type:complete len:207 (+) Transcript_19842:109-729(+)